MEISKSTSRQVEEEEMILQLQPAVLANNTSSDLLTVLDLTGVKGCLLGISIYELTPNPGRLKITIDGIEYAFNGVFQNTGTITRGLPYPVAIDTSGNEVTTLNASAANVSSSFTFVESLKIEIAGDDTHTCYIGIRYGLYV